MAFSEAQRGAGACPRTHSESELELGPPLPFFYLVIQVPSTLCLPGARHERQQVRWPAWGQWGLLCPSREPDPGGSRLGESRCSGFSTDAPNPDFNIKFLAVLSVGNSLPTTPHTRRM